jgi:hypothetical protein
MPLPKFLDKISHKEKKEQEYFFALQIEPDFVKSAVWTVEGEKPRVVSLGTIQPWSGEKTEDLILAADASISAASGETPPQAKEPSKVIFGLNETWVEEDKIAPIRLKDLKTLCQKLDFKPAGFVVTTEAMVQYLKLKEGVPPTTILINISKNEIIVTLVKLGKILGSQIVKRSQNLGEDVHEGLFRFKKVEILPSKMLLLGSADLEEAKQELLSFPWQKTKEGEKKLPFLHFPKIENLEEDFDIKATALAGGTEVAKAAGIPIADISTQPQSGVKEPTTETEEPEFSETETSTISPDAESIPEITTPPSMFGAVPGFIKGEDILKKPKKIFIKKEKEPEKVEFAEFEPEKPDLPKHPKIFFPKVSLPRIPLIKIPKVFLPSRFSKGPLIILFPLLALVGIFTLVIAAYWYLPKAKIILFLEPQNIEKKIDLIVDPKLTSPNESELKIPGTVKEINIDGEKTSSPSGKKEVGEKAKGEVTLYNKTDSTKTFPQGTTLLGSNNLKFTLDADTSVASKSSEATEEGEKIIYGKTNASVTAEKIGADYNLPAESTFKITNVNTDQFEAKNQNAFSGGTSREVQAVSKADQDNLLDALINELKEKAKEKINLEISSAEKIIEDSLKEKITKKTFDKEIGDEAQKLNLKLVLKITALTYKEDEFLNLIQKKILNLVPSGYELKQDQIQTDFKLKNIEKDGQAIFEVTTTAKLIPKIDIPKISQDLTGKKPDFAETYLRNLTSVAGFEISFTPKLPKIIKTLPRNTKNISIEVETK